MVYYEENLTVHPLKGIGKYLINKIIEDNGNIYYEVYNKKGHLIELFKTAREVRQFCNKGE